MSVIAILLGLLLFLLVFQLCVSIMSKRGLRVLMYHKLSDSDSDGLTVKVDVFEKQLSYLTKHDYQPITIEQLIQYQYRGSKLPDKPVLITFDDGYENNYTYLYPLLKKYGLKATIFLPVGFIGKSNFWDEGNEPIMNYERLKEMSSTFIEFGLHSFSHINHAGLTEDEVIHDITECKVKLTENAVPFVPAIAYPYGAYPREEKRYAKYREVLTSNGILFGFRIGNKINKLPISDPYSVKRIDVRGTNSFFEFKIKMLFGRVKPF